MARLILILFVLRFCADAQNLNIIPNPSFEDATNCYPGAGGNFQYIVDWYNATNQGTPDYFALCGDVGQPSIIDDVKRHSGIGRIGLFTHNDAGLNAREYIAVAFIDTLKADNYCLEYFLIPAKYTKYGTNDFGAYFGNGHQFYIANYNITQVTPQLNIPSTDFIIDTAHWYHYEGVYSANGNETDIVLGSFKDDNNITVQLYDTSWNAQAIAYLVIDDVSLHKMSINSGNDAVTCPQNLITTIGEANLDTAFKSYYWYDASNNLIDSTHAQINVNPTSNTFYIEEKRMCGQSLWDTVFVNVTNECPEKPIIIPNILSPNDDGLNDTWQLQIDENYVSDYKCTIYNRYGTKLFESVKPKEAWTGHTTSGMPCSEGVYYYIVEFTNSKQEKETHRGYLSLFR